MPKYLHTGIHTSPVNEELVFVRHCIEQFISELEHYEDHSGDTESWRNYSDRSLLGLMADGLMRTDKEREISIIQDFNIGQNRLFGGRCDMFISCKKEKTYFVESQLLTTSNAGHLEDDYLIDYFTIVQNECSNRINRQLIPERFQKPYFLCLIFNQIKSISLDRFSTHMSHANAYIKRLPKDCFYTFIQSVEPQKIKNMYAGLEIYGRLTEIA